MEKFTATTIIGRRTIAKPRGSLLHVPREESGIALWYYVTHTVISTKDATGISEIL